MGVPEYFYSTVGIKLIDYARKTNAFELVKEFSKSEYYNINDLEQLQFNRLKTLLIHCKNNVPFYTEVFCEKKFNPQKMKSFSDIEALPILTKDTIREKFNELKASNFKSFTPRIKETGGSTGEPLTLYHDRRSHGAMWANIYRGFGHAGYNLGDRFLILAHGSMLPKKIKFGYSLYYKLQNAIIFPCYHIEDSSFRELEHSLIQGKVKYIYGYSSTLVQFAKYLKLHTRAFPHLKAIFTTADMLLPEQRKIIESSMNVPVFDNYGCPEAGVMTWECHEHNGYHYNMESSYIETIDKDDSSAGKIISTNLMNYAFPIVRYDTGDIGVIKKENCECGRAHTKIKSLIGRQRDVITLRNGRIIHGAFFNHLPDFYDERVRRFQIVQPNLDTLEVHLDLSESSSIDEMHYLSKKIEKNFNHEINIKMIEGDFRESKLSKKHRPVISDVDNRWTR